MTADTGGATVAGRRATDSRRTTTFGVLDRLVHADPQQVIVDGTRILAEAADDPMLRMEVWTAVGRALYELGDMNRARTAIRAALRFVNQVDGDRPDTLPRIGGVRMSAAAILAETGDLPEALVQLERAEAEAGPEHVGRIQSQRAYVLSHAGRLVEARAAAAMADASLRSAHDELGRLRLLVTRAVIELQRGELRGAEALLSRAQRWSRQLGQPVIAAGVVANLGVVHARAGRALRAVQHFDEAERQYVAAGSPLRMMAVLETDRAESYIGSGLFDDAVDAAQTAVARAAATGNLVTLGDAELLLARSQLAAGLAEQARRSSVSAATSLRRTHRSAIALQARAVGLEASLASARSTREAEVLFGRSRRLGARLEREGWAEVSDALRVARIRCAARLGLTGEVEDDLVALRRLVGSRVALAAVRGRYAEAIDSVRSGDRSGAVRAALAGMRTLERARRSMDDLAMRIGLSALGQDLASLAVRLALESGDATQVFRWAERTRDQAYGAQRSAPSIDRGVPGVRDCSRLLDGGRLVEFVVEDQSVSAVVIGGARAEVVPLGPLSSVQLALERLHAWMDRAVSPGSSAPVAAARSLAQQLDDLLLRPLGIAPATPLVIVPSGVLHGVPWSALPSCVSASVVVHHSARGWIASERRAASLQTRSIALIAGPDVAGLDIERTSLRRRYDRPRLITGGRATSAALLTALHRDEAVQIAAHGTFDGTRPLRSSLRLHGGEMPVFELLSADVRAPLVLLSSCEAGVHGLTAGGEVVGLVAILLSRGAATVIAPVHTVADLECAEFVAEFHDAWADGADAAHCLATVRARWMAQPDPQRWLTAAAFVCFGSGRAHFQHADGIERAH